MHAPWCEACADLDDEVAALAAKWQAQRRLRVASFDVGANDLPRWVGVRRLPALLLFTNAKGGAAAAAAAAGGGGGGGGSGAGGGGGGSGGSGGGGGGSGGSGGGGGGGANNAPTILDLSEARTAAELSARIQAAVPALPPPPVDPAQLAHLISLLPQLAAESTRLLEQNRLLQDEVGRLRRRLNGGEPPQPQPPQQQQQQQQQQHATVAATVGANAADLMDGGDDDDDDDADDEDDDEVTFAGEGEGEMFQVRIVDGEGTEREVLVSRSGLAQMMGGHSVTLEGNSVTIETDDPAEATAAAEEVE